MDLSLSLSSAELDELTDFLVSAATPEDAMDISMLDGYLTALLVGPQLPPQERWLPGVWAAGEGERVQWKSPAQEQRIHALIQRHMNGIVYSLENDPRRFEPLLLERKERGRTVPVIEEWCSGFVQGMALDEAAWEALLNGGDEAGMLTPILLHGTEPGWQQIEGDPDLQSRYEEFAAMLGDCVLAIRGFWRKRRSREQQVKHAVPPPGRNDPCTCGSGRKHKKCCGADA